MKRNSMRGRRRRFNLHRGALARWPVYGPIFGVRVAFWHMPKPPRRKRMRYDWSAGGAFGGQTFDLATLDEVTLGSLDVSGIMEGIL